MMKTHLFDKAQEIRDDLVAWRRDFHMHPELGFQEFRTAETISEMLRSFGLRVKTGVGKTGVVAECGQGRPVIAIRADMDALPILESNEVSYRSRTPGTMHACGHDAHSAIALGVAAMLSKEDLPGTVRFLFQPAEEVGDDEGVSGAPRMIADGAMDSVGAVLALHVDAAKPVGSISIQPGPDSAGVDSFYAKIKGVGGHGSAPHKVVDPIYLAGHVILALHGIVSRRTHPYDPAVVSIGTIQGGQATNVIPEQVELSGTLRYLEPHVQKLIHTEVDRAFQVSRTLGGDYQLEFEIGYPPMTNDPGVSHLIKKVATELLGEANILPPEKGMGAEDFGFMTARAPGAMFSLGCRIEGDERKHHSPRFDIDENCLPLGAALLSEMSLRYLRDGGRIETLEANEE
jgi:amidohydrolase